jgi:hypothetical protein
MIGPRWFQIFSVGLGPAVVVGTMLVHVRGVDYTVLQPVGLSIVLFVAIPGTYAALLTVVAEHYLKKDGRFMTTSIWLAGVPLLLWLPLAPVLGVLVLGCVTVDVIRRTDPGAGTLRHPIWPWVGRVGMSVLSPSASVRLLRDDQAARPT